MIPRVVREQPPQRIARPLDVDSIVRDRKFPRAIDRVTGFEGKEVLLETDYRCLREWVHIVYEHADGAPILPAKVWP